MMKNITVLTVIIVINFIFTSPVAAQTLSLSLWPPLLEVTAQPGRAITAVYKLTNNSDHSLQIYPQIYPFTPLDNLGQIKINYQKPLGTEKSGSLPNFSFESKESFTEPFFLDIGETRQLVLKTALPKQIPEKDYYYTLIFSTDEIPLENPPQGGQTSSITQIGSNILISASLLGKTDLSGKIVEFSTPTIIDSFSAVDFKAVLQNTGGNLWKPFGQVETEGLLSKKAEIPLLEQNVLAYSSRQLSLESFRPKIPFGPFKARLKLTLNENGPPLFQEVQFWFFPYKGLGIIITLALSIILVRKIINKFSI